MVCGIWAGLNFGTATNFSRTKSSSTIETMSKKLVDKRFDFRKVRRAKVKMFFSRVVSLGLSEPTIFLKTKMFVDVHFSVPCRGLRLLGRAFGLCWFKFLEFWEHLNYHKPNTIELKFKGTCLGSNLQSLFGTTFRAANRHAGSVTCHTRAL